MNQIGITLNWNERYLIKNYNCNIVQILFQEKTHYLYPENKDLFEFNKYCYERRITIYIHISVNLNIAHAYSQNFYRIKTEILYEHKVGCKGFIIHCGSRKDIIILK